MQLTIRVFLLTTFTFFSLFSSTTLKQACGQELITPDSEFVKSMVRPAVAYLKANYVKRRDYGNAGLVGLAIFNAGLRLGKSKRELKADPILKEILDRCSGHVATATSAGEAKIYALCVSGLLLLEVDEVKYNKEINNIINVLYERQMQMGAWSYNRDPRGDTSQTQYAALFLWLAKEKKFKIKASVVENAIKWLIATQHPSGGYVYKASPTQIVGNVTPSLTAAGLGSVYLLGDAFGLHGGEDIGKKKRKPGLELLPPSVTMVVEGEEDEITGKKGPVRNIAGFGACKARGDGWFRQNFKIEAEHWTYYYLYGFERYSSFKERAEKINPEAPDWYVRGAKYMKQKQNANGSWAGTDAESTTDYDTSFAILFLVRSTKLIIPSYMDIVEGGGNGLPEDGELTMKNGRLVNKTYRQDFDSVLALIETGKDTDWASFENKFDSLILSTKNKSRASQLATLRKLVMHENAVARKVAVKSIGKFRDFENVPFLILALSDPEPEIAKLANEGLRFVSRKFNSQKLSNKPNKQEITSIVKFWSKWYLEVVPDGRLIELE